MSTGLSVIESRWWNDGNDSVRPLFEVLCGIVESNPHSFRYDMFAEERSLSHVISEICSSREFHSIYIGAHGDDKSICGMGNSTISRTVFRNIIKAQNSKKSLSGVYFGSCLISTEANAHFWLDPLQKTNLKWIAGYNKSVDWIDSSAVDMIFWSKYLEDRKKNRSRRKNKKTELEMAKYASSEMKKIMPTVFNELGFNVYYLDSGGKLANIW